MWTMRMLKRTEEKEEGRKEGEDVSEWGSRDNDMRRKEKRNFEIFFLFCFSLLWATCLTHP